MPVPTTTPPSAEESAVLTGEAVPVPLALSFEELLGPDTSLDETADDIIEAVRQWRDMPSARSVA